MSIDEKAYYAAITAFAADGTGSQESAMRQAILAYEAAKEIHQPVELSSKLIVSMAMEAGFSLSTGHGQAANKLMPISDTDTLKAFAKLVREFVGSRKRESVGEAAIQLAFEAGCWHGQVELEEHFDREQYSQVMPEAIASRKTSTPGDFASTGRTVRVNLRSNEWRVGVRKSVQETLQKARSYMRNQIEGESSDA